MGYYTQWSDGIAMSMTTTAGRSFLTTDRLAAVLRFADHFEVAGTSMYMG
jgi:hypothetical protein